MADLGSTGDGDYAAEEVGPRRGFGDPGEEELERFEPHGDVGKHDAAVREMHAGSCPANPRFSFHRETREKKLGSLELRKVLIKSDMELHHNRQPLIHERALQCLPTYAPFSAFPSLPSSLQALENLPVC